MIRQNFIFLIYNKDVVCVIDQGKEAVCTTAPRISRRSNINELPSHDPYIPRNNTVLFNCSVECKLIKSLSMTELVTKDINLKSCFKQGPSDSPQIECETIRYHNFKNIDKLLFLSTYIHDRTFYAVDCLIYSNEERVCHRKNNSDGVSSHVNLVDTGAIVRPKEVSILSQDEFICEETKNKEINCDLNPYIPFANGLKLKEAINFGDEILLKSGSYVVILKRNCIGSWCGYSGNVAVTRRSYPYRVPGDTVYRCYYANKQQICKFWYSLTDRALYNDRGFLTSR